MKNSRETKHWQTGHDARLLVVAVVTVVSALSLLLAAVPAGAFSVHTAVTIKQTGPSIQTIRPGSPLGKDDFEIKVGRAMNVLRDTYPSILTEKPDFTIYAKELEVIDPSGVKLNGLENYKSAFSLLHAIVNIFYCPERSSLTFRMCYDRARQNIRIHWNAQVIPKAIFGGYKTTLHVDGISVYELCRLSGNITQHRVERLIINDATAVPDIFSALRQHAVNQNVGGSIPVFFKDFSAVDTALRSANDSYNNHVTFLAFSPFSRRHSTLFDGTDEVNDDKYGSSSQVPVVGDTSTKLESMSSSSDAAAMESSFKGSVDWEALERKNASRKKFGLKPLTPEEFVELQQQVAELDQEQVKKRATAAAAKLGDGKKNDEKTGFFKKLFGNALEDTCESNFDCQRPEVCCDFGFLKKCCTTGMRILDGPQSRQGQLAEVPVIANPSPYPPTGGDTNGRYSND